MENVRKRLDTVFKLLNTILVYGDGVDAMFAVKQELRALYKELDRGEEKEKC